MFVANGGSSVFKWRTIRKFCVVDLKKYEVWDILFLKLFSFFTLYHRRTLFCQHILNIFIVVEATPASIFDFMWF